MQTKFRHEDGPDDATRALANARVTRFGATLRVVVPAESRVRLIFSITRLDKDLRVLATRDEALRAA